MNADQTSPRNIDAYIAAFPEEVRDVLEQVRTAVREAAPDAEETISYKIPTFMLSGKPLVYFAGHKKHVGFYPVPVGNAAFGEELSVYTSGKGTAKFPLNKPLPLDLIRRIVAFRMKEVLERAKAGKKKQGASARPHES